MELKISVIFGVCLLIGLCWSRDQNDGVSDDGDEDGGISREYDTSKWKDPHDMFGDDFHTEDNGMNFCPKGGCEESKNEKDENEKDEGHNNEKERIEKDQFLNDKEKPPNKTDSKDLEPITNEKPSSCHNDETAYFKHFIRIFSQHMEPLQNEEHKYGAQIMINDYDYEELKVLLNNEISNNNKILDIFSNAFMPLSRSPLAFIKSYINLHMVVIGLVAMTLFIILYLVTHRMFNYPLSIIRNLIVIFFILFLMSVPWEWYRMYQKAFSEKVANSARLVPEVCKPPSKMSPVDILLIWFKDTFSLADDECIKYHDNILVDPFWEVTPFQAITVCATRFFLEPMKLFSSGFGQCFRLFFKEVPAQWQPLVFFAFCFFVTLLVLTHAGMEIWTPLLRFGVRPRDDGRLDALQTDNARLKDQIEVLRIEIERRPVLAVQNNPDVPQEIEEVGVGGVRPRQDANDVCCDYEIVQNQGDHKCNRFNRDNLRFDHLRNRDDREPNLENRGDGELNRENVNQRELNRDDRELNRGVNIPNYDNRVDRQRNRDNCGERSEFNESDPEQNNVMQKDVDENCNNDEENNCGSRVFDVGENPRAQPIENLVEDRGDNEHFEILDREPQEHEEQLLHER